MHTGRFANPRHWHVRNGSNHQGGALVWKFVHPFDAYIQATAIDWAPQTLKEWLLGHAYESVMRRGRWVLCGDMMGYCNHAEDGNLEDRTIIGEFEGVTFAARDIAEGEELTQDYRQFDANAESKAFVVEARLRLTEALK